jgi:hypothetical protein
MERPACVSPFPVLHGLAVRPPRPRPPASLATVPSSVVCNLPRKLGGLKDRVLLASTPKTTANHPPRQRPSPPASPPPATMREVISIHLGQVGDAAARRGR